MDDVKVGDFSKPLVPPAAAPTTTKDALDIAERRLGSEASAVESELRPLSSYEDKLRDLGVTKEQAAKIVDDMLTKGFWSEEVPLTKSLKIRIRTRSTRDTRRAQVYIETQRPQYEAHYNELLNRQLIAASLEAFGQRVFVFPPRESSADEIEKAFNDRFAYVESMSDPAYRLVGQKLGVFDRKISIIMEEGVVENF